jgi:hypothetical protein
MLGFGQGTELLVVEIDEAEISHGFLRDVAGRPVRKMVARRLPESTAAAPIPHDATGPRRELFYLSLRSGKAPETDGSCAPYA